MVKQCYFILIVAVAKVDCGVEILWKSVNIKETNYPNFSEHVSRNYFKALMRSDPHCFEATN